MRLKAANGCGLVSQTLSTPSFSAEANRGRLFLPSMLLSWGLHAPDTPPVCPQYSALVKALLSGGRNLSSRRKKCGTNRMVCSPPADNFLERKALHTFLPNWKYNPNSRAEPVRTHVMWLSCPFPLHSCRRWQPRPEQSEDHAPGPLPRASQAAPSPHPRLHVPPSTPSTTTRRR